MARGRRRIKELDQVDEDGRKNAWINSIETDQENALGE